MLPFLPAFIPNLMQIMPFVLVFSLLCAPALRKYAGVFYALWTLAVVAVSWHEPVLSILQDNSPAFVTMYATVLDAATAKLPVFSTVTTLLTSSFTGVCFYLIVMFIGAMDKTPWVKRLLSVRSELSIIGGIIIMGHVVRIIDFPFLFMNPIWSNMWGEPAGTFMFIAAVVIGPLLTLVFVIPWVTSFKVIRKRMTHTTWKKTQKLAYPFMALMLAQGFFLALGHCLYGYPFEESNVAMSIMSGSTAWLETFAQQVATAWMYLFLGVSYLVARLRKRTRSSSQSAPSTTDCSSKVETGWSIVSNGLADLDISLSNAETLPYDELKERAYREHWEEKGSPRS